MDSKLPQTSTEKLENWLLYYRDLGITSFYRDRPMMHTHKPIDAAEILEQATKEENSKQMSPRPASTASSTAPSPASVSNSSTEIRAMAQAPGLFRVLDHMPNDTLEFISSDIGECTRCKLHRHRNKIVFGVGNPKAELMFIGEGPGHDEDIKGLPFVGRAGQLLTQMIEAMGLTRDEVYIANVVKCRPPENRLPEKDEVSTCMPFLLRQIAAIQPKVIVCLGSCAAQNLLNTNKSISRFRGEWCDFHGARLLATYHPAYLLRNPHAKPEVWNDLKKVMKFLGLTPPVRSKSRT
jgi:uracil-DNA glycosylase